MTETTETPTVRERLHGWLTRTCGEDSAVVRMVRGHRRLFCLVLCGGLSALSFLLTFVVRFDLSQLDALPTDWHAWFVQMVGVVVALRTLAFMVFGLHRVTWRYAGAYDILPVGWSVLLSSAVIAPTILYIYDGVFPRSVLAMDTILCFLLLAAARFSYRLLDDTLIGLERRKQTRVLIVGGGSAGNLTVRAMLTRAITGFWPVGILDDDPYKHGTTIQGVRVYGGIDQIQDVIRRTVAEAIVIALPTANTSQYYKVIRICKETGLPLKTIPDLAQILDSSNVVNRVSDFRIEDLLHRRPIRPDLPEIHRYLDGRTALVTGAAGSIGSELCRQIAEQGAAQLVCVDKDENGLFRLEHQLRELDCAVETHFYLADVKDRARLDLAFMRWRPEVVFHAAAYKHVPILQHHPTEAVLNNVGGTRTVAELADAHGAAQFVLISTDKAVNPTSVMGATKRVAERVVRARNEGSATRFSAIRFGNVLGSAGSVVELFLKQIRTGHPVTVTHSEIERYFMTIPEAVHLVLYSATMGRGGETFILDMGKPVKIDQLARQMIRLSGLTPDVDVPIEYTGLRPGEKLYEELWTDQEEPRPTGHPGILLAPSNEGLPAGLDREVDQLLKFAAGNDLEGLWRALLRLVPTFKGRTEAHAAIPPDQEIEGTSA